MKTIEDLFREARIEGADPHKTGRQYTKCPSCSSDRKGLNRNSRCLAVNIDSLGIRLYCNHCDDPSVHRALMLEDRPRQQGGQVSAGQGRSISDRAMPKRNGYEAMHKTGRAQWSRR